MDFKLRRGTLVDNPEIKQLQNGNIAIVTLAEDHSKPIFEDDEIVEWERTGVSYFDCVAFGEMAKELSYFEKGEHIVVTDGTIKQNKWEDDEGDVHYDYRMFINDFEEFVPANERE